MSTTDSSLRRLRRLEVYYSVQGEGPRVGTPTVFVRFAGCNLRCPGWPCDTQHAIDPALYQKEQRLVTCGALGIEVASLCRQTGARNVCLTGGEPMLQHTNTLMHFVTHLWEAMLNVEMFSNGLLPYPSALADGAEVVMDWKLPGSGEDIRSVDDRTTRLRNLALLRDSDRTHAVKFTIASTADLARALEVYDRHLLRGIHIPVFVGPVWGKIQPVEIVEWLSFKKLPWRLTLQTHKYIWDPDQRGV
jgi:7-carboxy-7-deazaguanine synthase